MSATPPSALTPEQIRDAMAAVFREESAARAEIAALGERLNVTTEAVVTFLRILGENEVPLEKLPETLGVIAQRHVEMLDRLEALAPEDAEINAKVEAARAAIEEGNYDRADRLLGEAEDAERAAIGMAEELAREAQAAVDRRRLNAAAARAGRGEIALTQLDYLRAADHFEQATTLVPSDDDDRRGDYLNRYAMALYRHGDERGDNVALLSAIDVYRQALEALPRARVPLQWAM
jgi:tetratricopeptide (TPR) repeat protein